MNKARCNDLAMSVLECVFFGIVLVAHIGLLVFAWSFDGAWSAVLWPAVIAIDVLILTSEGD